MSFRIFTIRVGGGTLPNVRRHRQHGRVAFQVFRAAKRHWTAADVCPAFRFVFPVSFSRDLFGSSINDVTQFSIQLIDINRQTLQYEGWRFKVQGISS